MRRESFIGYLLYPSHVYTNHDEFREKVLLESFKNSLPCPSQPFSWAKRGVKQMLSLLNAHEERMCKRIPTKANVGPSTLNIEHAIHPVEFSNNAISVHLHHVAFACAPLFEMPQFKPVCLLTLCCLPSRQHIPTLSTNFYGSVCDWFVSRFVLCFFLQII